MADFNQITLIGRLGRDPELTYSQAGKPIARTSMAVNRERKGEDGKSEADWFILTAFGKLAEVMVQYCKKGDPLFVQGATRLNTWTNQEGEKQASLVVLVNNLKFLKSKPADKPSDRPVPAEQPESEDDVPF